MQGRLSAPVCGRIQAFPWADWQDEFRIAHLQGFQMMEWTLDQERLYQNPLMTSEGQDKIKALCARYAVAIPSLTADCFMQAPFWKARKEERQVLNRDFLAVVKACGLVGISLVVVPLVDNGRLENDVQESALLDFLHGHTALFCDLGLKIIFESDFGAQELLRLITQLPPATFGINYDIGNSAGMGFDPADEIRSYGHRILNVHIKDRVRGGTTVPLGEGDADFESVFAALRVARYYGSYILQTARAVDEDHVGTLVRYRNKMAVMLSDGA
jgi:L-ribulose-5-phosphate 3-epimerase